MQNIPDNQPLVDKQIGAFLKYLREMKSLSLNTASVQLQSDSSTLSRIETAKTTCPQTKLRGKILALYGYSDWEKLRAAARARSQPNVDNNQKSIAAFEVLETPDAAYTRLCEVIKRLDKTSGVKDWFLGALHGVDVKKRHPERPAAEEPPSQREFGRLLKKACNSVGQNRWRVQVVANLIHPERLAKINGLLKKTSRAACFELKFVMLERSLSMLSPCILGHEDAFIGIQDLSYYRVQSVIHLRGSESNKWLRNHWDIIWGQAKWLRRATQLEQQIIDKIRAAHAGDKNAIDALTK